MLSAEIADLQIKVGPSQDSAVASYLLRVKTKSSRGESDDTYQETDVLFKRDGAWKVVYLHYSPARRRSNPSASEEQQDRPWHMTNSIHLTIASSGWIEASRAAIS